MKLYQVVNNVTGERYTTGLKIEDAESERDKIAQKLSDIPMDEKKDGDWPEDVSLSYMGEQ